MQTVIVTFERIFDVHRWEASQNSPRHTTFGFVASGKSYYAVSVPDWPSIEAGTTITAFLREEGNWQSLAGWINQQTNEIATPNYRSSFFFAFISGILALLGCIGFFGTGSTISTLTGKLFAAAYVFLLTLMTIFLANQGCRRQREVEFIKTFSAEALKALARD
jgi:hypothetical protein